MADTVSMPAGADRLLTLHTRPGSPDHHDIGHIVDGHCGHYLAAAPLELSHVCAVDCLEATEFDLDELGPVAGLNGERGMLTGIAICRVAVSAV
jgi:hypothetical protein